MLQPVIMQIFCINFPKLKVFQRFQFQMIFKTFEIEILVKENHNVVNNSVIDSGGKP